ncbi:hypothetical protein [Lysinibacillus irui]|uniref:hypothetical protein n=1 Tax=Lysinibacillus irui TaxID=2998077 RepID=UPI002AD44E1C|nr:hypothetical protein [Lysinibacillus irui]MEA0565025.1 hypothetical protein [Lysinibacillus irui]
MAKAIQEKVEPIDSEDVKKVITSNLPEFSKEQLVRSQKYYHRRDALNALLEADKQYSFAQVDEVLKKFDKGGN